MTPLERFIATGEIEISVSPEGIRRLATLQSQAWQPTKRISLNYLVEYLDAQGNKLNVLRLPSYNKALVADKETKINNQMTALVKPVEPQQRNFNTVQEYADAVAAYTTELATWTAAVSEYDYFMSVANNPTNIFETMFNITLLRVSQGKLDT